ncbi:MAG: hypothetical protein VYE22_24820 [Myxococcota bacterium]|nr:hypothetical protein [Myxococcota bacterium]
MSSKTQKTERRRQIRQKTAGKKSKAQRAKQGTPKFPIDPKKAGPDSAEKLSS